MSALLLPQQLANRLDRDGALALSHYHRQLADELECLADRLAEHDQARQRRRERVDFLRQVWAMIENRRAAGLSFDQALGAIAAETGLEIDLLRAAYRRGQAHAGPARREARAIEIARLARQGFSDAEIGAKVGLHPKSVNRILSQDRADTIAGRAPSPLFAAPPRFRRRRQTPETAAANAA